MTLTPNAVGEAVKAGLQAALEVKGGANASYIPFLAGVPSHLCGVCAVTPDGQVFDAGDTRYGFAIESISKVFTLALALEQSGREAVRAKIGTRPTGMPFNSVMALELHGDKPLSPLVNAGAIATASFIKASGRDDRPGARSSDAIEASPMPTFRFRRRSMTPSKPPIYTIAPSHGFWRALATPIAIPSRR
jgi:glutaminase